MHIWSLSLCLALICFTCSVHSQSPCSNDSECDQSQACCGNICTLRAFCGRECTSNVDCSYGDECDTFSGRCVTPTDPPTWSWLYPTSIKKCYRDSDCFGSSICTHGECVDHDDYSHNDTTPDEGGFSWSTTKIVGIIFFAAVAAVLSCLYRMFKNGRKPPALATQNAQATTRTTNTAEGTDHETRPTRDAVSNGRVVIAVLEVNESSPPLPPDAPPPYNTLEFEPQERNENEEQPPPSYDEVVRHSTMALV